VVWDSNFVTPGNTAPGDMVTAPRSSGAPSPWVAGLLLLGYLDSPFLPINWGLVENNVEEVCSQVEATKRMLQEKLVVVDRDILHPIQVCLKKSGKLT
jgi:hypothetical protein